MTETLSFRAATTDDIPAVVALVTSAYRGDVSRQGWTTEADLLDGQRIEPDVLKDDITRARSRVLLAERDGALLACAHIAEEHAAQAHSVQENTVQERGTAGYFGMFSVRPDLQGSGLGKTLLAEAERVAREELRLRCMRMAVIDIRDELIAFYERRGYRRTGVYKPFPYGDTRFGKPKRDDLRFELLEKQL